MTVSLGLVVFGSMFYLEDAVPIATGPDEASIEASYATYLRAKWCKPTDWNVAPGLIIRQYRFPSGRRADIMAFAPEADETVVVVEVKRAVASHRHISQLRRYMREFRGMHPGWNVLGQLVALGFPPDVCQLNDDIAFTMPEGTVA